MVKLNIANPSTGTQKLIEIEDDRKVRVFYDKRISQEVAGDSIGDEFKGYVFKITGGMDKQGVAMKQGVLTNTRVRLLLNGDSHFRPHRSGERRRKSIRGAIVGADNSVINLVIIKKGDAELPGLTNATVPRRLGPKRASKIRKLFNLGKDDDVRSFVLRRKLPEKEGKKAQFKAPKIQRLVTPVALRRKKHRIVLKKQRFEKQKGAKAEYEKLVSELRKTKRAALLKHKRTDVAPAKTTGAAVPAKKADDKKAAPKKADDKKAAAPAKVAAPKKADDQKAKAAAPAAAAPKKGGDVKPKHLGKHAEAKPSKK